ncbi:hypothetical protein Q4R21_18595, partial [Morganella morganii]
VDYHQTNQKTDSGKTLKPWPVLVDHYTLWESVNPQNRYFTATIAIQNLNTKSQFTPLSIHKILDKKFYAYYKKYTL